jgi:pimeloyl-ACP methyl ester carboxylesterase
MIGRKLVGSFVQAGRKFDLTLSPGKPAESRPQTPVPPFNYKSEEVSFANENGNAIMSGTLTYPVGYGEMRSGSIPVVLMVTGSGQQNRDEEIFGHKPFLVIADYLAKRGIASLRYDDRGVDGSTGDASESTIIDNMNDALAGIDFLRSKKIFGKVGILGHSEGGCISFMAGSRGKVDFAISLAGPGVRGDSVLTEQNRKALILEGTPQKICDGYCKALKEVLAYKMGHGAVSNPDEVVDFIIAETKTSLPDRLVQNLSTILSMKNPWLNYFIAFDPQKDISEIKCPVFALNGDLDSQVPSKSNLYAIRSLLPDDSRNKVKEYPGLNHLFQHCKSGSASEYNEIEETISPEVLEDISDWIDSLH